ncbi:DUF1990 domain-containing protein [Nocardia mangyaensis]|uniref:DUF1990 domain-containing protein n=1 Tax=Nocardia mangyaensis TaxID=2213200 RepID=A0A1J0VTD4_9NOCA|nr:DUF1990 domain-containing protein [Nocardia mangyaensis]APE35191.1 DUF1990 domain-containing protein [Nocardia mangyaensis]
MNAHVNGPAPADLSYGPAGATTPGEAEWGVSAPGFRRFEQTVVIGRGDDTWVMVRGAVLEWEIKRRSGFRVLPQGGAGEQVAVGSEYRIVAGWGPVTVHEPVRVVAVVDTSDRCGFAYGTLPGHPVSGEEAFVVHRCADGTVSLTLRSLTRAAPDGLWRQVFPALLLAQWFFRRRYLRALVR